VLKNFNENTTLLSILALKVTNSAISVPCCAYRRIIDYLKSSIIGSLATSGVVSARYVAIAITAFDGICRIMSPLVVSRTVISVRFDISLT
jgi:hypothetical protein